MYMNRFNSPNCTDSTHPTGRHSVRYLTDVNNLMIHNQLSCQLVAEGSADEGESRLHLQSDGLKQWGKAWQHFILDIHGYNWFRNAEDMYMIHLWISKPGKKYRNVEKWLQLLLESSNQTLFVPKFCLRRFASTADGVENQVPLPRANCEAQILQIVGYLKMMEQ